ncbi:tetratricopeptide repeat protein [Lentisphaera marina]|uniref:tetratricopeptide repeat protein n=1 Tax=Lentisphaera marina TaxID=1111041 RepID=UPI002366735D|nr:tetratricopeptide repeat protein [Lentisphaera marina]MDD7983827.1 tetratricopeptide repeat protein [Lentisphaera marina]
MSSLKGFLVALIIFVLLVAGANPISSWLAESGFHKKNVKQVYFAAGVKRNLLSYESAQELYKRIIKEFPEQSEAAFYQIAFCLDRQGHKQEAREAYSKYLNDYPSGQYSEKAQKNLKELMSLR